MVVEDGRLTRFVTAMTGELFAVLRKHSVLKNEASPDDPAAFAEAMVALAGDAGLRHALGARGRAWAAAFTWDRLAAQQERFYREVLAATAPSPAATREDRDTGPA
jgi:2-dehydro-3-deoxygalactonokinase